MADQGRWFKLWITAPYDPDLANLSLEDFGRWCLFGVYLKTHGTNGSIKIAPPAIALQQLFRVHNYDNVVHILNNFPSTEITVSSETVVNVTWRNWLKYQGDLSTDRVRKFRDVKRSKRRGEEKRREEIRKEEYKPPNPLFEKTKKGGIEKSLQPEVKIAFEDFWTIYPSRNGKKLEKQETWRRFAERIGPHEIPVILAATRNYANSEMIRNGAGIKDPKRFLYDGRGQEYWREWIEPENKPRSELSNTKKSALGRFKDFIARREEKEANEQTGSGQDTCIPAGCIS